MSEGLIIAIISCLVEVAKEINKDSKNEERD